MVTKLSHTSLFVNDQDKAYDFYVNKLGFKVNTDAKMENGFRWLTVTPPEQPELEIVLFPAMEKAKLFTVFLACAFLPFVGKAQKTASNVTIDSLPESQIDIPIQINLKPIYALAERKVDTVFTSPNYPNDWVDADCATHYKYHF